MTILRRASLPVVLVVALVPFAVSIAGQRAARWTPVFDLAMIELRVRDASQGRWPLLGLVGRIGTEAHVGSHPGPLAFYLLAPLYRLLGSTSWAYQTAALAYHGAAVVVAVLLGWRRAGAAGAATVAAAVALVVHGFGMATLAEPWNPFLPVLWFVVCVVATWSVVAGDRPMLLVAVFAAALCTQTHVPYLAVTTSLLGIGAVACVLGGLGGREGGRAWRTGLAWFGAAAVLGAVLWSPPVIEQLTASPERGNLSVLVDHFGTPPEEVIGFRAAWDLFLRHLDLWHLVAEAPREPGLFIGVLHRFVPSTAAGSATVVAWALSAAASVVWLQGRRSLLALHVVVGVLLAAALFALARIFGVPSYYLTLWAWTVCAFTGVAIAWTVVELARRVVPAVRAHTGAAVAVTGLALVAGLSAHLVVQPRPLVMGLSRASEQLGRLVPASVEGMDAVDGPREERWLVTWTDIAHLGSQGYGIVNELERAGFDVGVIGYHRWNFLAHRVRPGPEATARVHLAVGATEVAKWRAVPGAEELASDDPLTPAQRRRSEALLAEVRAEYAAAGWDDLVAKLEFDLWSAGGDPRVSGLQSLKIGQVRDLGVPAAVFIVPVDAAP